MRKRNKENLPQLDKYKIRNIFGMGHTIYTLDQLKELGESLPKECQEAVNSEEPLTYSQQKKLSELLSLSVSIWGGHPNGQLDHVNIEDYATSFYIHMVKYLKRFDRSKGCWVARCKYIGFDTRAEYFREIKGDKRAEEIMIRIISEYHCEHPEFFCSTDRVDYDEVDLTLINDPSKREWVRLHSDS